MLKKGLTKIKGWQKRATIAMMAFAVMIVAALPASAANPDLDTMTGELIDGSDSMKTNAMLIISAAIVIFIIVFGIGWLMGIFKKKMSKAG